MNCNTPANRGVCFYRCLDYPESQPQDNYLFFFEKTFDSGGDRKLFLFLIFNKT